MKFKFLSTVLFLALTSCNLFAGVFSTPGDENIKLYIEKDPNQNADIYYNDAYKLLKEGFTVFKITKYDCGSLICDYTNIPQRSLVATVNGKLLDYTMVWGTKYPILTSNIGDTITPDDISLNTLGEIEIKVKGDLSDELVYSEYRNAISTKLRPMLLKFMTNQVYSDQLKIDEKHKTITILKSLYGTCENYNEIVSELKGSKYKIVNNSTDADYTVQIGLNFCGNKKTMLTAKQNEENLSKKNWYADNESAQSAYFSQSISSSLIGQGAVSNTVIGTNNIGNANLAAGVALGVLGAFTAERPILAEDAISLYNQNKKLAKFYVVSDFKADEQGAYLTNWVKLSASKVVKGIEYSISKIEKNKTIQESKNK